MRDYDQLMAEINGRKGLNAEFIISILAVYVDALVTDDEKNNTEKGAKDLRIEADTNEDVKTIFGEVLKDQDKSAERENEEVSTRKSTSVEDFPFLIVLDLGDRDLSGAILHDHITGNTKPHIVRDIMSNIANALHHLHEEDQIHADLKPLNFVQVGSK